jgi:hypothetical protein
MQIQVYNFDPSGKEITKTFNPVTIDEHQKSLIEGFKRAYSGMKIHEKVMKRFFKANKIQYAEVVSSIRK